jgi:hypothetical protein
MVRMLPALPPAATSSSSGPEASLATRSTSFTTPLLPAMTGWLAAWLARLPTAPVRKRQRGCVNKQAARLDRVLVHTEVLGRCHAAMLHTVAGCRQCMWRAASCVTATSAGQRLCSKHSRIVNV